MRVWQTFATHQACGRRRKSPVTCLKTVLASAHGSLNRCDGQSQALHAHSRWSLYGGLRSVRPRTRWCVWRRLPTSILLSSLRYPVVLSVRPATKSYLQRFFRARCLCARWSGDATLKPIRCPASDRNGHWAWKHEQPRSTPAAARAVQHGPGPWLLPGAPGIDKLVDDRSLLVRRGPMFWRSILCRGAAENGAFAADICSATKLVDGVHRSSIDSSSTS
jgi:hypothetical protein